MTFISTLVFMALMFVHESVDGQATGSLMSLKLTHI
jgi:hypothetical protein